MGSQFDRAKKLLIYRKIDHRLRIKVTIVLFNWSVLTIICESFSFLAIESFREVNKFFGFIIVNVFTIFQMSDILFHCLCVS